jgi:hypothetical protein
MGNITFLLAAELELEDPAVWELVRVAGTEVGIRPNTPSATVCVAAWAEAAERLISADTHKRPYAEAARSALPCGPPKTLLTSREIS